MKQWLVDVSGEDVLPGTFVLHTYLDGNHVCSKSTQATAPCTIEWVVYNLCAGAALGGKNSTSIGPASATSILHLHCS
jgi:hypothetical protein